MSGDRLCPRCNFPLDQGSILDDERFCRLCRRQDSTLEKGSGASAAAAASDPAVPVTAVPTPPITVSELRKWRSGYEDHSARALYPVQEGPVLRLSPEAAERLADAIQDVICSDSWLDVTTIEIRPNSIGLRLP